MLYIGESQEERDDIARYDAARLAADLAWQEARRWRHTSRGPRLRKKARNLDKVWINWDWSKPAQKAAQ